MAQADTGGNGGVPGTDVVRVGEVAVRVSQPVVNSSIIILSVGLVLAVLEVIYLSFLYPSHLNVIIGVATPLVSALIHAAQAARERRKKDPDGGSTVPD